ncbi:hypothetical protein PIB30_022654 [Stylosanthes scabra]|uniref:Disease resistance RPP13-like protein 1 n=1 Tax=Stylosanthes scabra TaxID=79078 RepID=A0ABU6UAB7_9FABA|nr:hypothetical protein [Stylosanthes scabra]
MAAGRAFLSSFVDAALNKVPSAINSIPARKPEEQDLLRRLRKSLRAVRPVLDDAEKKQINDPEVKNWLVNLQDALYMADDMLDELSTTKASTITKWNPGNSSSWSRYIDDILEGNNVDEIGAVDRMRGIVFIVESLVDEKDEFPLEKAAKDLEDMSWRNQTKSLLEGSDFYGRDKEKEEIIEMLLDDTCHGKLYVISIEGIGGVGKTTLAQVVYDDDKVKGKFDIRVWISVATKFDPVNVTKAIIEEVDSSSPCHELTNCRYLEMLPKKMQDLVNLRYLDVDGASRLKEMPKGMSKLTNLNFLSGYIVGEHEENGIRELATLENLHGSFCISKLQNVKNGGEALEAKIGDKKHIDILALSWDSYDGSVGVQTSRDILDKLQPHGELKELSIKGYRGENFPDWLGLSSYCSMTKLELSYCKNCSELPSLGQLPSLKYLRFYQLDGLERIGCEFYKNNKSFRRETAFKSLESLTFENMRCWKEWHFPDEFDGFPQLKSLSIYRCPVLTGNLPRHLPTLEELIIVGCQELACSLPRAPKLHKLVVDDVSEMRMEEAPQSLHTINIDRTPLAKSVLDCVGRTQPTHLQRICIRKCWANISISWDHLPASLQRLSISGCPNLTLSGQLQVQQSLKEIFICECDSLKLFPLVALPNLEKLEIGGCINLECFAVPPDHDDDVILPSLRELSIYNCPLLVSISTLVLAAQHLEKLTIRWCSEIDCFPEVGLPPSLRELDMDCCPKLTRWMILTGLHSEGLTTLKLSGWDEVESFPREGCLPTSLESLQIWEFEDLETLDCKALLDLTSLEELQIWDCEKLKNMTEERLPSSIIQIIMTECPLRSKLIETNHPVIDS